jgi:hypothetical protein
MVELLDGQTHPKATFRRSHSQLSVASRVTKPPQQEIRLISTHHWGSDQSDCHHSQTQAKLSFRRSQS